MARYELNEILNNVYDTTTQTLRTGEFGSSYQKRLDYDGRTDDNPVYVGYAARGVSSSTANWIITKLTYDGSHRVTLVQAAIDSWDNRASASFS